ncbi:Protein SLENDER RICE1-LIKE 1 [Linum grandiflorum]
MLVDLNAHPFHTHETEQQSLFSSATLDLLRSSVKDSLMTRRAPSSTCASQMEPPSLLDIIKIAAAGFINSSGPFQQTLDDMPQYNEAVRKQVELAQYLLNAADQVGRHKYEQAICSIQLCDSLSSRTGNPTQRLVHYYAQALSQRVLNRTGMHVPCLSLIVDDVDSESEKLNINAQQAITAPYPILGAIYAKIPFYQVRQLASVQAIVENVEKAKRIHIIDLKIRNGMQWAALIQALASRRKGAPKILKITALVTTTTTTTCSVDETGQRLADFAKSMKIPFGFRAVAVPNMVQIDNKQFGLDPKDVVVVYAENALHEYIRNLDQLEALMGAIRNIRPKVMVVSEREANLNSFNFGGRFVEVLFYYGAYFDCLDTCLDDEGNKLVMESMFLRDQVNSILANETARTATLDVWRKFFHRYWMLEVGLSPATIQTVDSLLGRFSGGRSCTVGRDGRSLIVGWKGTPMFSLSTWKFLLVKPLKVK